MSLPRDDEWVDPGPMDPPRRAGRRAWIVAAILLVSLLGSAWIWYATRLFALPDIGPPFDLAAFGTANIPEAENAFTYYKAAFERVTPPPPGRAAGRYVSWAQTPQRDRDWMVANRDAMRIWLAGTTKDRAAIRDPIDTTNQVNALVSTRMPTLIRLAQLAALSMEGQDEHEEAWVWHRAALRATRHCGMSGTFAERTLGATLLGGVTSSIRNWSDHPHVSAEMIRRAIDEVRVIDSMTPPLSQPIRSEYFALSRLLDDETMTVPEIARRTNGIEIPPEPERTWARRKFLRREPERSRRVARLVFANWLAVADLPNEERRGRRTSFEGLVLYIPPDSATPSARRFGPRSLALWVESTDLLKVALPSMSDMEKTLADEAATWAILARHLAEQLDLREHGRPVRGNGADDAPRQRD